MNREHENEIMILVLNYAFISIGVRKNDGDHQKWTGADSTKKYKAEKHKNLGIKKHNQKNKTLKKILKLENTLKNKHSISRELTPPNKEFEPSYLRPLLKMPKSFRDFMLHLRASGLSPKVSNNRKLQEKLNIKKFDAFEDKTKSLKNKSKYVSKLYPRQIRNKRSAEEKPSDTESRNYDYDKLTEILTQNNIIQEGDEYRVIHDDKLVQRAINDLPLLIQTGGHPISLREKPSGNQPNLAAISHLVPPGVGAGGQHKHPSNSDSNSNDDDSDIISLLKELGLSSFVDKTGKLSDLDKIMIYDNLIKAIIKNKSKLGLPLGSAGVQGIHALGNGGGQSSGSSYSSPNSQSGQHGSNNPSTPNNLPLEILLQYLQEVSGTSSQQHHGNQNNQNNSPSVTPGSLSGLSYINAGSSQGSGTNIVPSSTATGGGVETRVVLVRQDYVHLPFPPPQKTTKTVIVTITNQ